MSLLSKIAVVTLVKSKVANPLVSFPSELSSQIEASFLGKFTLSFTLIINVVVLKQPVIVFSILTKIVWGLDVFLKFVAFFISFIFVKASF